MDEDPRVERGQRDVPRAIVRGMAAAKLRQTTFGERLAMGEISELLSGEVTTGQLLEALATLKRHDVPRIRGYYVVRLTRAAVAALAEESTAYRRQFVLDVHTQFDRRAQGGSMVV